VVNADESEPGTFKDRCLMEEDPFAVIEATTLAGYAVGAENGWFFIRGEYPRSFARISEAVKQARAAGYLGRQILGHDGFNFDIIIIIIIIIITIKEKGKIIPANQPACQMKNKCSAYEE
jgi:NADH-quinone oxidoreductase subunit F